MKVISLRHPQDPPMAEAGTDKARVPKLRRPGPLPWWVISIVAPAAA